MNRFTRRSSKALKLGSLTIGGGAPIVVQSMNASPSYDVEANLSEISRLASAGCELSRISIPDQKAVTAFKEICQRSVLPLVADIHFDYRLALAAIEAGASALRINPGNIRSKEGLREVAEKAGKAGIPIRVGVNAGSLDPKILEEEGGVSPKALCRSALESAALLEKTGFRDICLSLKASDPALSIAAYRMVAEETDAPLHLGVTEAGLGDAALIRSAVGIGTLLAEGIGDTLRISLTADPVEEIRAAYVLLDALGLRQRGAVLISCPGCGRTQVDIRGLATQVSEYIRDIPERITVAVMGCAVNGPGEAREADLGIAGGKEEYLLFRKGQILRKVCEEEAFSALRAEIEQLLAEIRK